MCQHECCPDSGPFQLCCLRVSKLGWVSRFSACEKVLNHVSGAQVFFALALRPGGMRAPQIGGFLRSFREQTGIQRIFPLWAPQNAIYHQYSEEFRWGNTGEKCEVRSTQGENPLQGGHMAF